MKLTLVRHARTAWHSERRHVGRADIDLDEEGMRQASALAERLSGMDIEVIYSSPLSRCMAIAETVGSSLGLPVAVEEKLIEMDLGEWSGKEYDAVARTHGNIIERWIEDPARTAPPGGEALSKVRDRTIDWFDEAWCAHPWKNLLVVSHSTPIRFIISRLIGLPVRQMFSLEIGLASISEGTYNGSRGTLELLNDTCHLHSPQGPA